MPDQDLVPGKVGVEWGGVIPSAAEGKGGGQGLRQKWQIGNEKSLMSEWSFGTLGRLIVFCPPAGP